MRLEIAISVKINGKVLQMRLMYRLAILYKDRKLNKEGQMKLWMTKELTTFLIRFSYLWVTLLILMHVPYPWIFWGVIQWLPNLTDVVQVGCIEQIIAPHYLSEHEGNTSESMYARWVAALHSATITSLCGKKGYVGNGAFISMDVSGSLPNELSSAAAEKEVICTMEARDNWTCTQIV